SDMDTLNVENGIFHAYLGENTPLPASLFSSGSFLWLETEIDGTILPSRRPLVSVAYSFHAQQADTALVALTSIAPDDDNTLNEAYDDSGPGTGRWIVADAGAVDIVKVITDTIPATDVQTVLHVGGDALIDNTLHVEGDVLVDSVLTVDRQGEGDAVRIRKGAGEQGYGVCIVQEGNAAALVVKSGISSEEHFVIERNGKVGIGTDDPADTLHLDVRGNIGCMELYQNSDIRLKTDVEQLVNTLGKVVQLRGVSFKWSEEALSAGAKAGEKQIGLIAQEVETVLPEVVLTTESGYKMLSYPKLTVLLIEAIKTLESRNKALEQRVEVLEAINNGGSN
ncbi:MAG: tail fiber domain-containing protein, partial [Dehalococcoidia bacterium]